MNFLVLHANNVLSIVITASWGKKCRLKTLPVLFGTKNAWKNFGEKRKESATGKTLAH